jgi:hypothetical protein
MCGHISAGWCVWEHFIQRQSISYPRLLDFKAQDLEDLISELIREDFQPYLTSVGGSGLGILSPYGHHRNRKSSARPSGQALGQVTPPETPIPSEGPGETRDENDNLELLRPSFETGTILELPTWADSLGRWLYV